MPILYWCPLQVLKATGVPATYREILKNKEYILKIRGKKSKVFNFILGQFLALWANSLAQIWPKIRSKYRNINLNTPGIEVVQLSTWGYLTSYNPSSNKFKYCAINYELKSSSVEMACDLSIQNYIQAVCYVSHSV